MKKILSISVSLMLVFALAFSLASCFNTVDAEGLWENATYRRDKSFGKGDTTFTLVVEAGEDSVTFTVNTDKTILADALVEHDIISGEIGSYGLSVYTVNGMEADFTKDNAYWAIYIGEDYAMTGVSYIEIEDGSEYRFVYSRA